MPRTALPRQPDPSAAAAAHSIPVAAGLTRLRFHDVRHSAASLLLAQGVSARMMMEILGHSQITLTLGMYSQILPQLSRETAEKMNSILTGWR